MSEYIEIETELSDDGQTMTVMTNLPLALDGVEEYASLEEMEEGSAVAQALAVIDGITSLRIQGRVLTLTRDEEIEWHVITAEISAVLKDFFL
jgi:hypothetical protein